MDEEGNGWTNVSMKLPMVYLGEKREKRRKRKSKHWSFIGKKKQKDGWKKVVWMNYGKQENTYYSLGWKEGKQKEKKLQN